MANKIVELKNAWFDNHYCQVVVEVVRANGVEEEFYTAFNTESSVNNILEDKAGFVEYANQNNW